MCILNGHLSVDQSALTGESVLKNMARESLVFAGSIIKRGEANAAVVAVGENTYFGKTAQLVQASAPNPHIQRILTRIVGVLMTLIIILIVSCRYRTCTDLAERAHDVGFSLALSHFSCLRRGCS